MAEATHPGAAPRKTLLEWFLGTVAVEVPNSRLAAALEMREDEDWPDWIGRAARVLGWEAERVEAAPDAVSGEHDAWWVTCAPGGRERWLVLAGARGERTQASVIDGHAARDVPNQPSRIASALDLRGPSEPVTWVRLMPKLPLERLRASGGRERLSPGARLLRWTRLERRTVLAVVAYSAVIGLLSLALPLAVQTLVDVLAFGRVLQPLIVISVALLLVLSLAAGLRVLEVYIVELLQRRAFVDVARDVAHRLPTAAPGAGGRWGLTELINRFFDVVGLQKSASFLLLSATEVVMTTFAGVLILAFYHPYLLVFDLLLLGSLAFVVFRLGVGGVETAVEESHAKYELAAWLESIARQQRRFLPAEGAEWSARQTDRLAIDWLGRRAEHFRIVLRQTIGFAGIQALASAALLGLGSYLVWDGQISLGQLVGAELIITGVLAQLAKFGKHLESFYDLNASVDKLGLLIDLETEPATGELLPRRDAGMEVVVEEVRFGGSTYSLRLEPGERVALSGLPHQDRVALFDALYGREVPEQGGIRFDGVAAGALAPRALRDHVAFLRGAMPVGASLEENLTSQDARSTPGELRELLAAVGLGGIVAEHDAGLQTWIHPDGEPLGHGELVSLEAARAVRARPRLLLVDAALDHVTKERLELLWQVLAGRDSPWTLLVASDRPDVVARCGRRLRWADGALREDEP